MRRGVFAVAGALFVSLLLAAWPAAAHDGHENTAPTVLTFDNENNKCVEYTGSGPARTVNAPTDTLVAFAPLIGLRQCTSTSDPAAPLFGDADDDGLSFTWSAGTDPDVHVVSVRLNLPADGSLPSGDGAGRIFFQGTAARGERDIRVDVTARDAHDASVSTHIVFEVGSFDGSAVPSLGAVSDATLTQNRVMDSVVLPAATGGDVIPPGSSYDMHTTSPFSRPYAYTVSGLPPGLEFDAATRTISGTPTMAGMFNVIYSAEDADAQTTASGNSTDTASSTFTFTVSAPPPGQVNLLEESAASIPGTPNTPTGWAESGPGAGEISVEWTPAAGPTADGWQFAIRKSGERDWNAIQLGAAVNQHTFQDLERGVEYDVSIQGYVTNQHGQNKFGGFAVARNVEAFGSLAYDSASVNGTTLTVNFDEALDASGTKPSSSVFKVTATPPGGSPRKINGSATAPVTIDGRKVTATLSKPVMRGETVTLSYIKPTSNPLRDTDDPPNEVEEFSGQVVVNNTTPSVTGIEFAGVAPYDADRDGSGDSYRGGDVIEAAVTFNEAVEVMGTPTLTLQVGANARAASYASGSGTATLAFRYTVAAGDADGDGVSVPANPIVVPTGASIGDSVGTASLAYGGRAADG